MPFDPGNFGPDDIIAMAREQGIIPPDVGNDQIMVVRVGVSVEFLNTAEDQELKWNEGDPIPHTSHDFSDPPSAMGPQEWRGKLIDAVNRAEDQDEFRFAVMESLGWDLVYSHSVPADMAVDAASGFADWLYDTFREAAEEGEAGDGAEAEAT